MNIIRDKAVILFFVFAVCGMSDNFFVSVTAALLSFFLTAVAEVIPEKYRALAMLPVSVSVVFVPEFFMCLPAAVYDCVRNRKPWILIPFAAVLFRNDSFEPVQFLFPLAGGMMALVLALYSLSVSELTQKNHEIRDSVTEKNLSLKEKNRKLIDEQDYEINLATLKERNRIAREIHDNVGHMLTRSLLQVGAMCVMCKDDTLKPMLESLRETLDSAMTSVRKSVHDLHDDSVNLNMLLRECLRTAEEKFRISFDYDISENIPSELKLCISGIVRESVSNAVRHSKGDRMDVIVREHPAFYQISVSDNGPCDTVKTTGIGLSNMRERAESAGGIINFTPSESGFRVFASIPKRREK